MRRNKGSGSIAKKPTIALEDGAYAGLQSVVGAAEQPVPQRSARVSYEQRKGYWISGRVLRWETTDEDIYIPAGPLAVFRDVKSQSLRD
jgi:hypothetical protein